MLLLHAPAAVGLADATLAEIGMNMTAAKDRMMEAAVRDVLSRHVTQEVRDEDGKLQKADLTADVVRGYIVR